MQFLTGREDVSRGFQGIFVGWIFLYALINARLCDFHFQVMGNEQPSGMLFNEKTKLACRTCGGRWIDWLIGWINGFNVAMFISNTLKLTLFAFWLLSFDFIFEFRRALDVKLHIHRRYGRWESCLTEKVCWRRRCGTYVSSRKRDWFICCFFPLNLIFLCLAVAEAPRAEGRTTGKYVPPSMREGFAGTTMMSSDQLPSIRVSNLPSDIKEDDLRELFDTFGRIKKVYLGKDKKTGDFKVFFSCIHWLVALIDWLIYWCIIRVLTGSIDWLIDWLGHFVCRGSLLWHSSISRQRTRPLPVWMDIVISTWSCRWIGPILPSLERRVNVFFPFGLMLIW